MGDPSGIGPEVTLKAMASLKPSELANFFVIGDRHVMERASRDLGMDLDVPLIDLANVPLKGFAYGISRPSFGVAAVGYLDRALELLNGRQAAALVTGPINKSSIIKAGFSRFTGHTEYLAKAAGSKDFGMMFVGKGLKVTVVTRHISLKNVPRSLSTDGIVSAIALTHKTLRRLFGIRRPKIGVAALNPHAGEGGIFGDDENRKIIPAIRIASRRLGGVYGPVPADVVFHDALEGRFDAVVSMYHDQGLIPFKMLYFKDGVNLTMGLPFVRTSPDHGTAFDIAGRMTADPSSMREAMLLAYRLSKK